MTEDHDEGPGLLTGVPLWVLVSLALYALVFTAVKWAVG